MKENIKDENPGGGVRYGALVQAARTVLFTVYFCAGCCAIHLTQLLALPLYLINKDHYYAIITWTKQCFGLLITTCQWWSPTVVRVSGDSSVRGQLRQTQDGHLQCAFPQRLVLLANHQLYSDWLYLWWIAYTNHMHGHIYILLKESLKYIPVLGPGMMFFEFIFLARNWAKDKPRLVRHLSKLKSPPSGRRSRSSGLNPVWLLLFPEGTNLSDNGRRKSAQWAEKQGLRDFQYQLHPRSTGLLYCLQELRGSVEWVYDCTVAYEGIPTGSFGQDIFTLRASYIQGRPPRSVNMYWRRFALSSIPLHDPKVFEGWLRERWMEKDALLDLYTRTGLFPPMDETDLIRSPPHVRQGSGKREIGYRAGYIEATVRQVHWWEFGQIFVGLLIVTVLFKIFVSLRGQLSL